MRNKIADRDLLAFMVMGERYTASRIANTLNANDKDIRDSLNRLADAGLIRNEVINRAYVYAKVATITAGLPPMAPMKISREMRAAMERAKELRENKSKF